MGSCESRETASGPARKYQSEQTEMKNTEDLRRDNTMSKPKKQLNRSDFTQYYEHIKKILKTRKFKFSEPNDKTTFLTKLANSHDIDNNTAKSWIHIYVDYMIFVAWQNAHSKRPRTIYPPYAIQQVAKLHATYTQNYIYFCRIITESKDIINLAPYKIIAKQITNDPDSLKNAYNSTKDFIWHQVYIHLGVRKSEEAKKQAEAVWEPFEQTFFKNEFTFSFLGASDVEEFIIKLSKYQKEIELKSKDFSEIIKSADILRDLMGIKSLIKTPGQLKLSLANKFLEPSNSTSMDAFSEVEAIPVTTEFVNVLAWEYRISIDMALDWILEYKKFLFLFFAYERKMRVSPSEIVDRVWHLHMQFTHDYHENIFKTKKFSHKPLKNDETEVNQQSTNYKKTLKAYAKYFGPPDPVMWPNNNIGFPEFGISRSFEWFFSSKLMTTEEKAKMLRMRTYQKRKDMVSERSVPDQTTSGDPNIDLAPIVAVVSVESGFLKDLPSF